MKKTYVYDWKEGVSSFFLDLSVEWQGRVCWFYRVETQDDSIVYIVSDHELPKNQIKI